MDGSSDTGCPGCASRDRRIADLEKRLEALERAGKRQAAPFSKGKLKPNPKKPGRKSGEQHGVHGHRPPPADNQIDETLEAALPEACPACSGPVEETHTDTIFQEEIPRRPLRRKFNIHCGRCKKCGKPCRGRHPLQTSDATGAAASQVGPDAQAAVVYLNKHAGLSHGKIADVFQQFFGMKLTRGAASQIVSRGAERLEPAYQEIKQQLKAAEHITPDETGWRVGGQTVWLHAWVGDNGATCYQIDPQRSADVLQKIIGIHWSGNMTHDGFSSYDRFEDAGHQQCVDHGLRRAEGLVETQIGIAKRFPQQVIDLFTQALDQRDRFAENPPTDEQREVVHEDYVTRLYDLTDTPRTNEANERFAKHLSKHAPEWFLFLIDPTIPATNHRAEQALKTPIVNRKVWGGNRTDLGAHTQEVTSSVLQTCKNTAQDVFSYLSNAFRGIVTPLFNSPLPANASGR